jgi:hypothetical protein
MILYLFLAALPGSRSITGRLAPVVVDGFLTGKDPRTFAARDNALEFRPDEFFQRIFAGGHPVLCVSHLGLGLRFSLGLGLG